MGVFWIWSAGTVFTVTDAPTASQSCLMMSATWRLMSLSMTVSVRFNWVTTGVGLSFFDFGLGVTDFARTPPPSGTR